ncbi:MAG: hypothetical protein M3R24_20780 [Chloroflexota bacterium]|nr:hypothetical protein [Chloroflexota bacterium]
MHDPELEALAHRAFPTATRIILAAGDPGGTLFHDADADWEAAGIAATSWDEATGTLYLRRLPPPRALRSEPPHLAPLLIRAPRCRALAFPSPRPSLR